MLSGRLPYLLVVVLLLLAVTLGACTSQETPPPAKPTDEATPAADEAGAEGSPRVLGRMAHEDRIQSLAFSPAGDILAVGTYLKADLYRPTDGHHLRTIEYRHSVDSLDFSPDGEILGAGQALYGVILSRVADGTELMQLHGGYNNLAAFSPDGKTVATGNRAGNVWLWNIEDGEEAASFEPQETDFLSALAYTPDGERVVSGDFAGRVHVWRVAGGVLEYTFDLGTIISDIAISPDGYTLAAGTSGLIHLYDLRDGAQVLNRSVRSLNALDFSPDGRLLAIGAQEGVEVWGTDDWALSLELEHPDEEGEPDWVTCVAFSPDGSSLATGTRGGNVYLWQITP